MSNRDQRRKARKRQRAQVKASSPPKARPPKVDPEEEAALAELREPVEEPASEEWAKANLHPDQGGRAKAYWREELPSLYRELVRENRLHRALWVAQEHAKQTLFLLLHKGVHFHEAKGMADREFLYPDSEAEIAEQRELLEA